MKNIIVLGGGYGGLTVIHHLLEKELPKDVSITLIDRMPYQGLKTEYYALAAGTVAEMEIRVQFPDDPRIRITFGDVTNIDLERKLVQLDQQEQITYDTLIIALGCTDKYHGVPGAREHTFSIQSLPASRRTYQNISGIKPYGQITIVGGGLSGVELASELRESRSDLNIRIMDRGSSILSPFPAKLQQYVQSWFHEHHVELVSGVSLTQVAPGVLTDASGKETLTDLTVWTAGIQPVKVIQDLHVAKDPQGRVLLNEYYQIPEYPDAYVIGDSASSSFAPSAQAAEAQGKQVAQVIQALWQGKTPQLETIKLKGVLGSLGKKAGFGLMGKRTVMLGRVPRLLKNGVLWMSKRHLG